MDVISSVKTIQRFMGAGHDVFHVDTWVASHHTGPEKTYVQAGFKSLGEHMSISSSHSTGLVGHREETSTPAGNIMYMTINTLKQIRSYGTSGIQICLILAGKSLTHGFWEHVMIVSNELNYKVFFPIMIPMQLWQSVIKPFKMYVKSMQVL